jgi:hypothetical protein
MPDDGGLARFMQREGMPHFRMPQRTLSTEERIERLSRLILVALLFATLARLLA